MARPSICRHRLVRRRRSPAVCRRNSQRQIVLRFEKKKKPGRGAAGLFRLAQCLTARLLVREQHNNGALTIPFLIRRKNLQSPYSQNGSLLPNAADYSFAYGSGFAVSPRCRSLVREKLRCADTGAGGSM